MNSFAGVRLLIVPNMLGRSKATLIKQKVEGNGGHATVYKATSSFHAEAKDQLERPTHYLVDQKMTMDKLQTILPGVPPDIPVVSSRWISESLELEKKIDPTPYRISKAITAVDEMKEPPNKKVKASSEKQTAEVTKPCVPAQPSKAVHVEISEAFYEAGTTTASSISSTETTPQTHLPGASHINPDKFVCFRSSANPAKKVETNPNQAVIETLQSMVEVYKGSKDDKWRVYAYQRAIHSLKATDELVDSYEKAEALPGVGKSLAEKISEIVSSGSLRKLDVLQTSDVVVAAQLFTRIWGVGPETASLWANQGLRSLDDIRENAKLNVNQKIGLEFFDEFDERMKRDEVSSIEAELKKVVSEMKPSGLQLITCGSYRRGRPTCGDIDVLITHPDGHSHIGVFDKLLDKLRETGLLTHDLTIHRNMVGGMMKYLGVCLSPSPIQKHRRIDIIVTPYDQFGCAMIYFTGSAHFNRSMRLLADKTGMSLTEHALYRNVIRQNKEIIHRGEKVDTPTEESVFEALGIPYRKPEERDHY